MWPSDETARCGFSPTPCGLVSVELTNDGSTPPISTKLTLVDDRGERILPALYSDNYLTVLPSESREVEIRFPVKLGALAGVRVRGWNVEDVSIRARPAK